MNIERRTRTRRPEESRAVLETMARTVAWWFINTDMSFDAAFEYVKKKTEGFDPTTVNVCRELAEVIAKGEVRFCETRIFEDEETGERQIVLVDCSRKNHKTPVELIRRPAPLSHREIFNAYRATRKGPQIP